LVSNVQNGPFGPFNWQLGNGLKAVHTYDGLGRVNGGYVCNGSSQPGCSGGTQLYGFTAAWKGNRFLNGCDTILNRCITYGYDDFGRATARTVTQGQTDNYTYVYDRWGNRWQQNPLNGGNSSQLTFNTSKNQVTTSGYVYDAAGNLYSNGVHTYSYDADGNLTLVDGGSTAQYVYNALNERVEAISAGSVGKLFTFNLSGKRTSIWDASGGAQLQGQTYWGGLPVEFYASGQAHFQHQDWLGTERLRTTYNGSVEAGFPSLPFGDEYDPNGSDLDAYHFAGLDKDYFGSFDSQTDHAQYRQYFDTQGQWMSPDPYGGSYDFTNPQSFNRYAYVLNDPLSAVDPSGQSPEGTVGAGCLSGGLVGCLAALDYTLFRGLLADIFAHQFHGSLQPRPNAQPWDEHGIIYGPNIAGALGLPDESCEFGACGNSLTDYNQQQTGSQLQTAYNEVTAGRLIGLLNIKNHSCGECKYDYGWNSHSADTWNVCGQILNADQMGNFMAGYQAGAYDKYYFWTTGAIWAQGSVDAAGVLYHLTGRTKATSDPLDRTGMPDILRGQRYARHGCGGM
jgi:RHS repeat-associated protein